MQPRLYDSAMATLVEHIKPWADLESPQGLLADRLTAEVDPAVVCKSLRAIPWVLASTQQPALRWGLQDPTLTPAAAVMCPNALSRYAVEMPPWLSTRIGEGRLRSSVTCMHHDVGPLGGTPASPNRGPASASGPQGPLPAIRALVSGRSGAVAMELAL